MDDDGVWSGKNPGLVASLKHVTRRRLATLGPAHGEPIPRVFNEVVDLLKPSIVFDDSPPLGPTPPGVVY